MSATKTHTGTGALLFDDATGRLLCHPSSGALLFDGDIYVEDTPPPGPVLVDKSDTTTFPTWKLWGYRALTTNISSGFGYVYTDDEGEEPDQSQAVRNWLSNRYGIPTRQTYTDRYYRTYTYISSTKTNTTLDSYWATSC